MIYTGLDEQFYFITSIVNMFWQIFTILFVLYKFTTFFGFIYNFTRFLGKMFKGIIYVKEEISVYFKKSSPYQEIDIKPSFFTRIKNWIFGNTNNTLFLPTHTETRTSFYGMENNDSDFEYNMKHFNYDSVEFSPRSLRPLETLDETETENEQIEIKEKPFNVNDSNIFFDSNFVMNILSRDAPKVESNEGFFQ